MLTLYQLVNYITLFYIEFALYKPDNIKIILENCCLIDANLFRPMFNYLKFYTIIYFIKCLQNYRSAMNYNIGYNQAAYKYFLKAFYKWTNKKEYKS